ncbi:DNA topology modulation protein [Clostridium tagluense]|uniref:DNA topology modulation protein n=1 Tax=Clostridium tagluense TaxID=360422 RepID=UPI001CF1A7E1|nr:DNA topology modulation protein [Clostridium tagluense]MCB2310464.1 DNA topology modulation protein [Clostridium tagluense]MCB2315370.1 DNA topology modulation protein [Clostridium tagluense]MCB2320221.1 DNA topology modulation protein [Clostridium tagluense]MCB2325112.1 DNA topology modulation protein [Clostridium tagluense]MCB2329964.1 DNA topology modulation protein [Clostridium tagluense]
MNNIGKRIMVIGSPGSGKSTFSRKLAGVVDLPLIHLDKEFWNNGWIETPKEDWAKKQKCLILGCEWILDGNYGGTMDIRLEKADTVICFKLSRIVCLLSYFKRVITNINKVRPDMPEGCREKIDFEFMKYIWNFPKASGQANINRLEKSKDKQIIVFKNRRQAKQYIIEISSGKKEEVN